LLNTTDGAAASAVEQQLRTQLDAVNAELASTQAERAAALRAAESTEKRLREELSAAEANTTASEQAVSAAETRMTEAMGTIESLSAEVRGFIHTIV
jgi:predicted  nucleic acid-binding Zn-ribbon protein